MEKIPRDLEIPEDLLSRVIEHARRKSRVECCGILAGKNGKITKGYSMENTKRSSSSYLMEPEEQPRIFREIEEEGLEVSAIYHSHPHSPAFPSQRDVDYAFYPDSLILIISLMDQKAPEIGVFQIGSMRTQRDIRDLIFVKVRGKKYRAHISVQGVGILSVTSWLRKSCETSGIRLGKCQKRGRESSAIGNSLVVLEGSPRQITLGEGEFMGWISKASLVL